MWTPNSPEKSVMLEGEREREKKEGVGENGDD